MRGGAIPLGPPIHYAHGSRLRHHEAFFLSSSAPYAISKKSYGVHPSVSAELPGRTLSDIYSFPCLLNYTSYLSIQTRVPLSFSYEPFPLRSMELPLYPSVTDIHILYLFFPLPSLPIMGVHYLPILLQILVALEY